MVWATPAEKRKGLCSQDVRILSHRNAYSRRPYRLAVTPWKTSAGSSWYQIKNAPVSSRKS